MKDFIRRIAIVSFLCCLLTVPIYATADDTLQASIAAVRLVVNGVEVQNSRSSYPLLFYNDITYFPLAFHYMRSLGLVQVWDEEVGLSIYSNPLGAASLVEYPLPSDAPSWTASHKVNVGLANSAIFINGSAYQSGGEWPFLVFADVPYLPMTWHNMVDNLGLIYRYDRQTTTLHIYSGLRQTGEAVLASDIMRLPQVFTPDNDYSGMELTAAVRLSISEADSRTDIFLQGSVKHEAENDAYLIEITEKDGGVLLSVALPAAELTFGQGFMAGVSDAAAVADFYRGFTISEAEIGDRQLVTLMIAGSLRDLSGRLSIPIIDFASLPPESHISIATVYDAFYGRPVLQRMLLRFSDEGFHMECYLQGEYSFPEDVDNGIITE